MERLAFFSRRKRSLVRKARYELVRLFSKERSLQTLSRTRCLGPLMACQNYRAKFSSKHFRWCLMGRQRVETCPKMSSLSPYSTAVLNRGVRMAPTYIFHPQHSETATLGYHVAVPPVPAGSAGPCWQLREGQRKLPGLALRELGKFGNLPCSLPSWSNAKRADGIK